jgi:hypothetical protein
MNTTRVLYMPIPMQLAGAGFAPPGYGSRDFKDEINPGINLRQTNPLGWQELNKNNIGVAFQGLLNTVTANPAQYTPGYDPMLDKGGHHPTAKQLIDAFTRQGISLTDGTGSAQLTPGGLNLRSNKGWSAGFNPTGGNINLGPIGIQSTWAGDKSIQATVNLGRPKDLSSDFMTPPMMQEFLSPAQGPVMQTGLSAGRQLMLEQTDEYLRRNPYGYR